MAAKSEARWSRNAARSEAMERARSSVERDDARYDREQALLWAATNGVDAKWLEGSIRKFQRDTAVRNVTVEDERGVETSFDPDTGRRISRHVTGGSIEGYRTARPRGQVDLGKTYGEPFAGKVEEVVE